MASVPYRVRPPSPTSHGIGVVPEEPKAINGRLARKDVPESGMKKRRPASARSREFN